MIRPFTFRILNIPSHRLGVLLLLTSLVASCFSRTDQGSSTEQPSIMILGDSLAEGLTNNLSARPGLNIIGGSIRGSGLGSSDIDWLQETKAQLANNFPDAVLISIGTNDTRAAANDFEWYARRTEAMMTLLDKLPTVWFLPPDTATNYLPGLDAIIRLQVETARHHRRNLILIHWPAGYSSRDGIHQSSAGYARAADEALKALRLASPRLSTRRI